MNQKYRNPRFLVCVLCFSLLITACSATNDPFKDSYCSTAMVDEFINYLKDEHNIQMNPLPATETGLFQFTLEADANYLLNLNVDTASCIYNIGLVIDGHYNDDNTGKVLFNTSFSAMQPSRDGLKRWNEYMNQCMDGDVYDEFTDSNGVDWFVFCEPYPNSNRIGPFLGLSK